MTSRSVSQIRAAEVLPEGQGVTVHRSIGTHALSFFDPFLLLDEFVIAGDAKGAGFPDHPHRGFETVTYMLSGRIEHADTAGHSGVIGPGAVQWMTAGRGLVHSEMPASDGEEIRGLQLWVNLAAAEKMKAPAYQEIAANDIPEIALANGGRVRVVAGTFDGQEGPVTGISLQPSYFDIVLTAGEDLTISTEPDDNAFIYLLSGTLSIGEGRKVEDAHSLILLSAGDSVRLTAGQEGARALFVTARPLGEPVARYGPFVMNTRQEIDAAIRDYRMGRL